MTAEAGDTHGATMAGVARWVLRRGVPAAVRIPLASTERVEIGRWRSMRNTRYFLDDDIHPDELRPEVNPDHALPAQAVTDVVELSVRPDPRLHAGTGHALLRAVPALDAVLARPRVVLLGEPGAGKTWLLAELTQPVPPSGTGGTCGTGFAAVLPAADLAARVAAEGSWAGPDGDTAVDGLDELPDVATRRAVLRALAALPVDGRRIVVACRTAVYADLAAVLGWPTVTLAPLTIGQVDHLVRRLVDDLAAHGTDPDQLERAASAVTDACRPDHRHRRDGRPSGRLRELLRSPLLVTAAVLRATARPERLRDAASWSQDVLDLLLRDWDAARGLPPLEAGDTSAGPARRRLDQLGYAATATAPRPGRGLLPGQGGDSTGPALSPGGRALVERCGVLTRTVGTPGDWCHPVGRDTGARHVDRLLAPDVAFDDVVLAESDPLAAPAGPAGFAALTLQEHCAAGHLLAGVGTRGAQDVDGVVARWLAHRAQERWAEPLLLAAERLDAGTRDALVTALLEDRERGHVKPPDRAQRDAVLAARILVRIAHPDHLTLESATAPASTAGPPGIARLRPEVRGGLVRLLADPRQPLPERERIAAGDLLGVLGDPRYPVTTAQWAHQVQQALAGERGGYLLPVPALGDAVFVGRYPLTVQQWRQQPGAVERTGSGRCPTGLNEPATATWPEAVAWCDWLSDQVDVIVRVPHESEWEAAAGCGDGRRYPWGDPTPAAVHAPAYDRAWTFSSRTRYGIHERTTVPVGCYPAGASPGGFLDLAGNVSEWTLDTVDDAPHRHVQRGGGSSDLDVRCTHRSEHGTTAGFRVVVTP